MVCKTIRCRHLVFEVPVPDGLRVIDEDDSALSSFRSSVSSSSRYHDPSDASLFSDDEDEERTDASLRYPSAFRKRVAFDERTRRSDDTYSLSSPATSSEDDRGAAEDDEDEHGYICSGCSHCGEGTRSGSGSCAEGGGGDGETASGTEQEDDEAGTSDAVGWDSTGPGERATGSSEAESDSSVVTDRTNGPEVPFPSASSSDGRGDAAACRKERRRVRRERRRARRRRQRKSDPPEKQKRISEGSASGDGASFPSSVSALVSAIAHLSVDELSQDASSGCEKVRRRLVREVMRALTGRR